MGPQKAVDREFVYIYIYTYIYIYIYFFLLCPPKLNAKTLSDTALACCPHLGFILVPCWTIIAHLGSILAPCWTILAPQSLPRSVLAPQKPPEQKSTKK